MKRFAMSLLAVAGLFAVALWPSTATATVTNTVSGVVTNVTQDHHQTVITVDEDGTNRYLVLPKWEDLTEEVQAVLSTIPTPDWHDWGYDANAPPGVPPTETMDGQSVT